MSKTFTRTGKPTITTDDERAVTKARVARESLAKAIDENADPNRIFQLEERAAAAVSELPEDVRAANLAELRAAIASGHVVYCDDEPEQLTITDVLAREAATIAKRRARPRAHHVHSGRGSC